MNFFHEGAPADWIFFKSASSYLGSGRVFHEIKEGKGADIDLIYIFYRKKD